MPLRVPRKFKALLSRVLNNSDCLLTYVDDFIVILLSYERCFEVLITLLMKLCFNGKWSKIQGPVAQARFLGLVLDFAKLTIELSP